MTVVVNRDCCLAVVVVVVMVMVKVAITVVVADLHFHLGKPTETDAHIAVARLNESCRHVRKRTLLNILLEEIHDLLIVGYGRLGFSHKMYLYNPSSARTSNF